MRPPRQEVFKIAFVVKDLGRAVEDWGRLVGAGPFFRSRYQAAPGAIYRGQPADFSIRFASGFSGKTLILLIQPDDERRSLYTDFAADGVGLHHIEARVEDFDAALANYRQSGAELLFYEETPGMGRIAYFDLRETLGVIMEIHELGTTVSGVIEEMAAAHRAWDGTRALRDFAELG